jgi:hypothetical protein
MLEGAVPFSPGQESNRASNKQKALACNTGKPFDPSRSFAGGFLDGEIQEKKKAAWAKIGGCSLA